MAVSWALTLIPLIVFGIIAMCDGSITSSQKVAVGLTLTFVLAATALNILSKIGMKNTLIWLMMLILYVAIDKLLVPLIVMFICTAINEVIVDRLLKYFKRKYKHNVDADERERLNFTGGEVANEQTN